MAVCKECASNIVAVLNECLALDKVAIRELMFNSRVECNEKIANHSSVQVIAYTQKGNEKYLVGSLGLINGIVGVLPDGYGLITAELEQIDGDVVIKRFWLTEEFRAQEENDDFTQQR